MILRRTPGASVVQSPSASFPVRVLPTPGATAVVATGTVASTARQRGVCQRMGERPIPWSREVGGSWHLYRGSPVGTRVTGRQPCSSRAVKPRVDELSFLRSARADLSRTSQPSSVTRETSPHASDRRGRARGNLADKANNSDANRAAGAEPGIPPRNSRKAGVAHDRHLDNERDAVEHSFARSKQYRRVAAPDGQARGGNSLGFGWLMSINVIFAQTIKRIQLQSGRPTPTV